MGKTVRKGGFLFSGEISYEHTWYHSSMKTNRGFVATALLVVVAAMFVTGGLYIYSKTQTDRAKDDLISNAQRDIDASRPTERTLQISADLAWARTRLQMETTKLNQLKQQSVAAQILNSTLRDTYLKINDAITGKTDVLFANARSLNPNLRLNTPAAIENRINAARSEITQILSTWQTLVGAGSSPQNIQALQNAITSDLPTVTAFLQELATIVNNLTPGNSGLTAAEIIELQVAINTAQEQVTNAATTLTNVISNPSNNSNPSDTNSNNVQNQQNIIDQIQEEIEELEEELENPTQGSQGSSSGNNQPINQIEAVTQASTTSSGYYGDTDTVIQSTSGQIIYPPNPAPVRPPREVTDHDLIEGTN